MRGSSPRASHGMLRFITLTVALGGLQLVWSVETGFGSLYLLSLGMKKSLVSLVWLAGPLSGLITQPLVGVLSDRCTAKMGRRRPYIIGATILTILCLLIIGWTRELAGGRGRLAVWLAVVAFYVLDFAVNCMQASLRALIVDVLPTEQQDRGTAWASRMIGVGNVTGYLMGFMDLAQNLPFLGSTQMQVLTSLAIGILATTIAVTCWFTNEIPISRSSARAAATGEGGGGLQALGLMLAAARALPPVVKRVCRIQLFAWIGWFPFLFYSTTYVAGLYAATHTEDGKHRSQEELLEEGTRAGSRAMFAQAVGSLVFSVVLPWFVRSSTTQSNDRAALAQGSSQLTRLSAKLHVLVSLSLPAMWTVSLAVFSLCMFATWFTSSVTGASWLIGICGFSWAVAIWVPFSIIGETISSSNTTSTFDEATLPVHRESDGYVAVDRIGDTADIPLQELGVESDSESTYSHPHSLSSSSLSAGTVLGIHNVFIVVPQFITAFVSSLLFAFFEHAEAPGADTETGAQHARQIGMVLRLGGIAAAAAAYFSWKLQKGV
ncbi:hypothetical protein GGI07_001045 [Coemansia sp. Benny D115]|nr:hypothetical protein GGI07_001045 [Coemansia sp. Benny D115]